MRIGNWNYRIQNPFDWRGQCDYSYPDRTLVIRPLIVREWIGELGPPPF